CDPGGAEGNCDIDGATINEAGACDDGDVCTEGETCTGGACGGGSATAHIHVNLDVEALGFAVTRDVAFEIAGVPGDVVAPVDFNTNGEGSVDLSDPSYLDAASICATEGHTLTGTLDLTGTWGVCEATANFTIADQLLAGDLSNPPWVLQDNLVDITDFAILSIYWNQSVDPDLGSLADITGDGMQDVADFTAIQVNFAEVGATCVSTFWLDSPDTFGLPIAANFRVAVDELMHPDADLADWNGDGLIDTQDIRAFARANNLRLTPQFRAKLGRIDTVLRGQTLERSRE
ncbi:MAG: hypothetical protein GY778_24130, partial [bacterium]|nr:hypothetical protein [bacterium]